MERQEYDVFISYARKDYLDENNHIIPNNEISKILKRLDDEGVYYWFDVSANYKSKEWPKILVNSIESSKVFVYLSTENANKSEMTSNEIAIACEFRKPIIPIRVDFSPYNKTVMFRIANIDYIEYYKNAQVGLDELIVAIKSRLADLQKEEMKKKREEVLEKERVQEEQQQIIDRITSNCSSLSDKEKQILKDRNGLLLEADKIIDKKQRNALKKKIIIDSPISIKVQEQLTESGLTTKPNKKLFWLFGIAVFLLLTVGIVLSVAFNNSMQETARWKSQYIELRDIISKNSKVENLHIIDPCQGDFEFTGQINYDSLPVGKGKAVFINGDVFEGEFNNGIMHEGIYIWKDGSSFVGPFILCPNREKGKYYPK
jgi:hypothetical protein